LDLNFKNAAMKLFFVLLVLPLFSTAQTVHVKDGSILYEGKETVAEASASEVYARIQNVLPSLIEDYQVEKRSLNKLRARGELKLKTPYNVIRTVDYSIELTAMQNGYEYVIDSVSFTEQKRGEKGGTRSSKEVLENMGEQGTVVSETERLLNETDMKFQKILAVLKAAIGRKEMQK
jgi:hypothetical protein